MHDLQGLAALGWILVAEIPDKAPILKIPSSKFDSPQMPDKWIRHLC
jgi:hypothetical protein